jgi:hypothetical protein
MKALLVAVAAVAAVVVLAVGVIYASVMNGGLDHLFAGDKPKESDPQVVAAREKASAELEAEGAALPVPAGSEHLATVERPSCQEGQHNWKIDDPYDLSCTLARTQVVVVPTKADFRAQTLELDAALTQQGWEPSGFFGLRRVMTDYWDHRASFGTGYSVDNLPTAGYAKDVAGSRRTLAVRWAEKGSPSWAITYDDRDDLAQVLESIPESGYALVLTESVEYFSE